MSFSRKILIAAASASIFGLAGCATPFRADVARFQALPPAQGQTFAVQSNNPRLQGGLEFQQYAALVGQRLAQFGYRPAADIRTANLVVDLDYGVDSGQQKVTTRPGTGFGYGGGYGGFGRGWYGRYGYRPYYLGWYDPFFGSPFDYPEVESYTIYTSYLTMTINRAADGQRLFEGKARARSSDDSLPRLVPNLVEAMFTNFPGRSGEEVKIMVPPPPKG